MNNKNLYSNLAIFTGRSSQSLTKDICDYIGMPVGKSKVETWPDGETFVKIEEDIRGRDCFVVLPTCPPVNENIMELLIYIDCLKRASASRVTAVIPYYGYARQDRKVESRTAITARLVADILEQKLDRVVCMDLHAKQIEGFFSIPVDHLRARPVIVNYLREQGVENAVTLSPDVGNMKVANVFSKDLETDFALIDKERVSGDETIPVRIVGKVANKNVFIFDDMISTAGTICSAAAIAKEQGALKVTVVATHGLFCDPAFERLCRSEISEIIVTDTIPLRQKMETLIEGKNGVIDKNIKLKVLSVADLLGEAIVRIHQHKSVSVLLKPDYKSNTQ
jgi:ribose-phosphate pyrophosphokinase